MAMTALSTTSPEIGEIRLPVSGRTPPLPDLRATDFFSTPVRGSMDAGQPDSDNRNSVLTLIVSKAREDVGPSERSCPRRNNGLFAESKHGQRKPSVNVTTNPLDISLVGACTSNNDRQPAADGSVGRTGSSKIRGRPAESHPLVSTIHSWVRLFFPFCAIGILLVVLELCFEVSNEIERSPSAARLRPFQSRRYPFYPNTIGCHRFPSSSAISRIAVILCVEKTRGRNTLED
nr:uncharacterized protein LOC116434253 [Nomia melanderi]